MTTPEHEEIASVEAERRRLGAKAARTPPTVTGRRAALLALQAAAGNGAVSAMVSAAGAGGPAVQRAWTHTGGKAYFEDATYATYDA